MEGKACGDAFHIGYCYRDRFRGRDFVRRLLQQPVGRVWFCVQAVFRLFHSRRDCVVADKELQGKRARPAVRLGFRHGDPAAVNLRDVHSRVRQRHTDVCPDCSHLRHVRIKRVRLLPDGQGFNGKQGKGARREHTRLRRDPHDILPILDIDLSDIAVILGTLLDNALDAVAMVGDRRILLDIEYDREVLYVKAKNIFDDAVEYAPTEPVVSGAPSNRLPASRKAGREHGFGLW